MPISSVRDLGARISPLHMNGKGDVVGFHNPAMSNEVPVAVLADGTVVSLPSELFYVRDISNQGLVLGGLGLANSTVFIISRTQ